MVTDKQRKRNTLILSLGAIGLALAIMQISCVDKFTAARIAVKTGQAATVVTDTTINSIVKAKEGECQVKVCKALHPSDPAKYQACLKSDLSGNADYVKCIVPIIKPKKDWPKAHVLINNGWLTALAMIDMAEQLEKSGQPVDWSKVLAAIKATACLTSKALDYLPPKAKAKVKFLIDMMGGWGCNVNPAPTPAPRP